MKTRTLLTAAALALLLAQNIFTANALASDEDRSDSLIRQAEEAGRLGTETLAAPLLFSEQGGVRATLGSLSMLNKDFSVGYSGPVSYQQVETQSFRLKLNGDDQAASFFYLFDESLDLRNRWFRLTYAGLQTPARMEIRFDADEARTDSGFPLFLNDSLSPDAVYFKVPDKASYSSVESIHFMMGPDHLESRYADFIIRNLEILPENEDPLAELPESDLTRFDWYAEPLKANNSTAGSQKYSF